MNQERRQFIRINARAVAHVKNIKTGRIRRALTKDVSGGGICLVMEKLLEPGTQLEVEMRLPDRAKLITFQGMVSWSRPASGKDQTSHNPNAEHGIRFISIDEKDHAALVQYVKIYAPPT